MDNLNKELDRLTKSIVDRAERLNEEVSPEVDVNALNIASAEALAIIANTKALVGVMGLVGKKETISQE